PSLFYQRFTHKEFETQEAFLKVQSISENRNQLEVNYSSGNRILRIDFEKNFPYQIMGWEEVDVKEDGKQEVTRAKRKGLKVIDYWKKNKLEDEFLRNELNLKY
ncbi:MAG: hypothetical protein EA341_03685, partial [Mongoliibacter sp.]